MKNYLAKFWWIFLLRGVFSIVFSTQVNSKWAAGDFAGAHASSEKAKKFAIWSAIIGAVAITISVIVNVLVVGLSLIHI